MTLSSILRAISFDDDIDDGSPTVRTGTHQVLDSGEVATYTKLRVCPDTRHEGRWAVFGRPSVGGAEELMDDNMSLDEAFDFAGF